jgi:hypothetical protein
MKKPRKAKNRSKPATPVANVPPLVGRYFHIWGDDGYISRQGRVIAQIDPTNYLVHFFWLDRDGVPDARPHTHGVDETLHVCTLDDMTTTNVNQNERAPGAWQFYEDGKDYRVWYEHCAPRRPMQDSSLGDATEQAAE